MKKVYINVRNEGKDSEIYVKVEERNIKLLRLILSESESVIGFWE